MVSRARTVWVALALGAFFRPAAVGAQAPRDQQQEPVDPYAPRSGSAPPALPAEPRSGPDRAGDPGGSRPDAAESPDPDAPPIEDDVDDQVARALYRRGVTLYRRGATADAKRLFIESLERSPGGRMSGEALRMLRAANRRLRIANLDDGRPPPPGPDTVLDPYGAGGGAPTARGEEPLDPYAAQPAAPPSGRQRAPIPADHPEEDRPGAGLGRPAVIVWSGLVGLAAGLAVAGPQNDSGELAGGAAVAGLLGAAGGAGLSYWLTERTTLTPGQSIAISSGATWGAVSAGLLGDATTGTDSTANDVWKYVAAGGLLGLGGGVLYARAAQPSVEDMAVTDSLGVLGVTAGLSIAAGLEPPESEAFALNALFGGAAGLTAGLLLGPRLDLSLERTLWIDAGALAGAGAAWAILYPLIADSSSRNDEQVVGWVSTATLVGGGVTAWYLTRHLAGRGAADSLATRGRAAPPAPPALARRQADGEWQIGVPFVRTSHGSAQDAGSGMTLAVDLVAGRF